MPVNLDSADVFGNLPPDKGGLGGNFAVGGPGIVVQPVVGQFATVQGVPGSLLAVCQVPTAETTTSTSPTNLATDDAVTFTLAVETRVLVEFTANGAVSGSGLNCRDVVEYDGVQETKSVVDTANAMAGCGSNIVLRDCKTLAAGTHTVRVKHCAVSGGTSMWRGRVLTVKMAP